jgi:hypothetical protein
MATQSLLDLSSLSPKFQELYAKAKDFVEVKQNGTILIILKKTQP